MNALQKHAMFNDARAALSMILYQDAIIERRNAEKADADRLLTREERAQIEAIVARFGRAITALATRLEAVTGVEEAGGKP